MIIRHNLKINKNAVKEIEKAQKEALWKTTLALQTDVVQSQTMPFDTGTMQGSMFPTKSMDGRKNTLVVPGPYSLRLYYHPEYNFQKGKNKNAQGLWFETYMTGEKKDFCQDTFQYFLKKEL